MISSLPYPLHKLLGQFPLWPLLAGILGGAAYADLRGFAGLYAILATAVLIAVLWRKSGVRILLAGFCLGLLTHGITVEKQRAVSHLVETKSLICEMTLEAVVIDTGSKQTGPYLAKVTASDSVPIGARILVSFPARISARLVHGNVIRVTGLLENIEPVRNPHGFDRRRWLHRQGANAVFIPCRQPEIIGTSRAHAPVRLMARWREKIRTNITAGLHTDGKEATLIRAVFLGERPPRTSALIKDFRESGTLHVFAVSGLHVGLVGAIIAAVLWFLRLPRWVMISGVILGMAMYAGVTGMRPPAVRAVIMATVFLSGFLVQRKPSLVNSLAASAVIVILLDGHQLFTPGFQLSYGVLLSIALVAGFWTKILKPLAETDPFLPRALLTPMQEFWLERRQWLSGSLAVSIAAWMGSAPLMWVHFGIITPISIIAGIPLVLLVFCILALAMLSLALGSAWPPGAEAVNSLNARLARMTYSAAATFADIPWSHHYRRPVDDGKTRIIVFDLPYGGGAHWIDTGGGILLDCGRTDAFQRHVMPSLAALRATPDSLIVSHADSKHSGAMSRCLGFYPVKQALIPMRGLRSPSYRTFLDEAERASCSLVVPRLGQRFELEPGVYLEILHAPAELDGKGRADDFGLVLMLHCHGWRIMFTGDAGYETEANMLESGMDLRADVIVMGRNRNDFTGSLEFYQSVKPKAIISTNADFPERERISESWLKNIRSVNAHVFDQQLYGAVTITLDTDSLTLTPTISSRQPLTLHR